MLELYTGLVPTIHIFHEIIFDVLDNVYNVTAVVFVTNFSCLSKNCDHNNDLMNFTFSKSKPSRLLQVWCAVRLIVAILSNIVFIL